MFKLVRRDSFPLALLLWLASAQSAAALVISEIHYHPPAGEENLEFVEVSNDTSTPEDISGYAFTEGIVYEFAPGTILGGYESIVVCADADAVRSRYGIENAVGNFEGRLDNAGERLTLVNHADIALQSVRYDVRGKWPVGPDGTGHTLSLLDIHLDPTEPESWSQSDEPGGTPGMVVVAVDEDRFEDVDVVAVGEEWRFVKGTGPFSDPAGAWLEPRFDDASWLVGPSGFGFGDEDDATVLDDMRGSYTSIACRRSFDLTGEALADRGEFFLSVDFDDGFCAFVNGVEVARVNCGDDVPRWDDRASASREAGEAALFQLRKDLLVEGANVIAIAGYNLSSGGTDFSLIPSIFQRRAIVAGGTGDGLEGVVFNELVRGAVRGEGWVEIYNGGAVTADASGLRLTADPGASPFEMPPGSVIAPGGFLRVDAGAVIDFSTEVVRLFLLAPDDSVITAVVFDREPPPGVAVGDYAEARFPDGGPLDWVTTTPTPGAANEVRSTDSIVINEILYHPPQDRPGEFIELYNRSDEAVDLAGFRFSSGIEYTFAEGSVLAAGGYVVIAEDPDFIAEHYGIDALGPYAGALANSGESLRLVDAAGNPVDHVRYFDGGRWSLWADGGGSSLELIDPGQDNSVASAWDASDETEKAEWEELRFGVPDFQPGRESELNLYLVERGICLIDDISITRDGDDNFIPNPGFESATSPWRIEGTHVHSGRVTSDAHSGASCLRVEATGKGDTLVNRLETDTSPRLTRGAYEVSLWARWQRGTNLLIAHGENHTGPYRTTPCFTCGGTMPNWSGNSMAAALRMTVPFDLGTPGAENSARRRLREDTGSDNLGPVISDARHDPPSPEDGLPIHVVARVSDSNGVASANVLYRVGSASGDFESVPLHDDGGHQDGVEGDGIYGASLPGFGLRTKVVFYIEAVDSQGRTRRFPRDAPETTCLFQVQGDVESPLDAYRLVLDAARAAELRSRPLHSNDLLSGTFVFDNKRAYYDIGTRYRGSPWGRPQRASYRIRFPKDDRFHRNRRDVNLSRAGDSATEKSAHFLTVRNALLGKPSPTPEFIHVRTWLDGAPLGNKADIQTIDGDFLRTWYGEESEGPLLKANGRFVFTDGGSLIGQTGWEGASLVYRGDDPENYRGYYFHGTRQSADNWEPLFRLTRLLDRTETPDEVFAREVGDVVDLEAFFRVLSSRILLSDCDGFGVNNGHNGFLVYDSVKGLWGILPFDLECTFRSNSPDIFRSEDPGVSRLLTHPRTRRVYLRVLSQYLDGYWSPGTADPFLDVFQRATGLGVGAVKSYIRASSARVASTLRAFTSARLRWLTNAGEDFTTEEKAIELEGEAPVQVEFLTVRRAGGEEETIDPIWSTPTKWTASFELTEGPNELELLGHDARGELVGAVSIVITLSRPSSGFVRGDVDGDGSINISDPITLLGFLFSGMFDLSCKDRGDFDDSGALNVSDAVSSLGFLFQNGSPPAAPYPDCGVDPTEDELTCMSAGGCP